MTDPNDFAAQPTLPDPDALLQACQAAQTRHHLFGGTPTPPQIVVVAVSGGADSVALLHVLQRLQIGWGLTLHVAHLDHNLRPESATDAHFVGALAAQWQLPFHLRQLSPDALLASGEGVEAAGRRARYQFLTEVALAVTPPTQAPVIALGHHADDQAETVLLHLVRGSGLRGLGGMRWISSRRVGDLWPTAPRTDQAQTLHLVRPFLGAQRADLLRYLRTQGLTWSEDSTNDDQQFVRNRLRHTILPALTAINPNAVQTLARTAQLLQAEADRLTALDQAALTALLMEPAWSLSQLQRWHEQSSEQQRHTTLVRVVLDVDRLVVQSIAAQRGILREALALMTQSPDALQFEPIDALLTAIQPPHHASGPRPLSADLAWSLVGASGAAPARLSLHGTKMLPFAPTHPFLDEAWRKQVGRLPLLEEEIVAVTQEWSLRVTRLPYQALAEAWRTQLDPWQVYLDADQTGQPALTTPRPGDVYAPLGMGGRHKSLGDFFTDRKVPLALRSGWPLVIDQASGELLWVGGYQPSHHARITDKTQVVYKITWERTIHGSECETTHPLGDL